MDRKSIIVIAACIVTLVLWVTVVIPKFTPPPRPVPVGTNAPVAQSVSPTAPSLSVAPTNTAKFVASTDAPEELLVVTNENARYIFTTRGGGLKEIELVRYPEKIQRKSKMSPTN